MNRITLHIENLLLSHDCVIVPGIGGFVTRFEDSFISEESSEIYPPYRSVSFNSRLRMNDGLLTQSYMTTYDTDYPKAQSMVEEDARALREQLHAKGEFEFGSLGTIQLTQSHAMIFQPSDENGIIAKELYGLMQCQIPEAINIPNEPTTSTNEIMKADNETDKPATFVANQQTAEQQPHTSEVAPTSAPLKDNKHYTIRLSKNTVHYTVAAVAAILLYFAFTLAPNFDMQQSNTLLASIFGGSKTEVPAPKAAPVKQATTIAPAQNTTAVTPAAVITVAEPIVETAPTAEVSTNMPTTTYTIVLASAVSDEGAAEFVKKLHKAGFDQAQISKKGNMTRVVYSSYLSQEDAHEALRNLKNTNSNFTSAWVLKQ